MTPTSKLRFVERDVFVFVATPKTVRILQQWWDNPYDFGDDTGEPRVNGEWRDVPLEEEQA